MDVHFRINASSKKNKRTTKTGYALCRGTHLSAYEAARDIGVVQQPENMFLGLGILLGVIQNIIRVLVCVCGGIGLDNHQAHTVATSAYKSRNRKFNEIARVHAHLPLSLLWALLPASIVPTLHPL
jgi:hypothetical protein